MKNIVGIFEKRGDAERAAERLIALGLRRENVSLLTPGSNGADIAAVKTSDTEEPGTGTVIGSVVGAAAGASAGTGLAALVPGVGPVVAAGWAAVALLGLLGAVGGGVAGNALESSLSDGLPKDDLFLYEDAVRKGHSVVIALADTDEQAESAQAAFRAGGAEDIDTARERWWIGVRPQDEEYREPTYRRGVEAALHPDVRGKAFEDAAPHLAAHHGDAIRKDIFRRGYERGRVYYAELVGKRH
jgi:hypothetical protein